MDADLLKVENKVASQQTSGTHFGGLRIVHPIGTLRAVDVGQPAVEVDDLLTVGLHGDLFDVGHVETGCVVDGGDPDGDGLIGVLLAVARTERDNGLAVDIVVNGLEAKVVVSQFNADHLRIGVFNDLKGEFGNVNGLTGVVGVRKVGRQSEDTAATFVDDLNGEAFPAGLAVFDDVEQQRSVGKFAGFGVIATVVHTNFNSFLTERALLTHLVVGEDHLDLFAGRMPGNKVRAVGGDGQVAQGRFGVGNMTVHAHFGAEITKDGGHGICDDQRTSVGKFKHVVSHRPRTGLSAAIHGSHTHVVVASRHGHAGINDVLSAFLS